MKVTYVNSNHESLDLMKYPYQLQTGTLFDHEWEYDIRNDRLSHIRMGIHEKKMLLSILNMDWETFFLAMNRLVDVTNADICKGIPGNLYVNDYRLECYIISSEKSDWEHFAYSDAELKVITSNPYWLKEKTYGFSSTEIHSTNNKRYSHRYPYRYANGLNETYIVNEHYADADFQIQVYGPALNPQIIIGGHIHQVNILLEPGELLTINSLAKTIKKTMNNGRIVNVFHYREKEHSVFRKIPPGRNLINWPGTFDFDITVYEERSEPKWQSQR